MQGGKERRVGRHVHSRTRARWLPTGFCPCAHWNLSLCQALAHGIVSLLPMGFFPCAGLLPRLFFLGHSCAWMTWQQSTQGRTTHRGMPPTLGCASRT